MVLHIPKVRNYFYVYERERAGRICGVVAAGASRIAECCSHFLPQENSWKCEGIAIGKRDFSSRQENSWKRERIAIGIGKRDFSSRQESSWKRERIAIGKRDKGFQQQAVLWVTVGKDASKAS